MSILAAWVVAFFGLALPMILGLIIAIEIATGRSATAGGFGLTDMHPLGQACAVLLVSANLVLALIGAAAITGVIEVRAP